MAGGLTGVNIPFTRFDEVADVSIAPASTLGWIVAALVVVAVIWRLIRGNVSKSLYASLGVLFTYWLAAGLSEPIFFGSQADAVRYIYPGSIGVLLVVTDAARGLRIRGFALAALFAVGAFSLAMNLVFLRDGGDYLRTEYSQAVRTRLAMLELGAGMQPGSPEGSTGSADTSRLSPLIPYLVYGPDAEQYLAATESYGSPAYSLDEIRSLPPELRISADKAALETTAYLRPRRSKGPSSREGCERVVGGPTPIELSGAGAYLKVRGTDPVSLSLVRFSDPPGAPLDPLSPGRWSRLELPLPDRAAEPWSIVAPEGAELQICPIPVTGVSTQRHGALQAPRSHQQFPLFDSLRALAAISILVVHVGVVSGVFAQWYGRYVAHLDIGVPFFFLLSAFLLYRPFVAARVEGRDYGSLRTYARRRFIRIMPAYWAVLTISAVVPGMAGAFSGNWWVYYGLLQSYPVYTREGECAVDAFRCGVPPAWSLAVEVMFYAVLPLFALLDGMDRPPVEGDGTGSSRSSP